MEESNFSFLTKQWDFLAEESRRVESYALRDPRAAAIYARRCLELSLKWLYQNDNSLRLPYDKSLAAMIHEPTFSATLREGLFQDIKYIHKLGNVAAHGDEKISDREGLQATRSLHLFLGWMVRVYTRGGLKIPDFKSELLPKSEQERKRLSNKEIIRILEDGRAKDEAERLARQKLSQTEAELEKVKKELAVVQAIKKTNEKTIGSDEYTESQTREYIIDVMLREAGWDPSEEDVAEYEVFDCMPSDSGKGVVDYVLWGNDGKPLALVEAKKTKKSPNTGKQQALLYADCLEKTYGQRPMIYYSNGYTTWFWDDTLYPPREVQGYGTKDELQWRINQRKSREDLNQITIKQEITGRHYQMEAARRVMESFEKKRRKSLIVMATGSGKTRLAISIVDMLMRGNWVRKVLFLADRRDLVKQAKGEFNTHLPHVSVSSLLDKKEEEARIIFSTYGTMLNCIDGTRKDVKESYSVAHFDLVIIDEAHRSVYQKYGAIFDYFDSLLLGLTATPRGEVDRNTYKLFELEDHQPTYAYELDQAVKDGFLVPPRAISVPLKFQREGIRYYDLSP
ncbi:MAG: DEAD/DEAH box helicase family protein, partial [Spirochaetota bacterium]|nr:DEAD/DEAH box helicase family protein [Spirochaetota bacterium]